MEQDQHIKTLTKDEFYYCYQIFESLASSLPPEIQSKDRNEQIDYLVKLTNHFRKYDLPKNQERLQNYKNGILNNYKPLYPQLFNFEEWEFDESYVKYINKEPSKLSEFLVKEHDNIYSFPIFKPSFCDKILKELDYFEQWCKQNGYDVNRPNSMNNYGVILDDIGMFDAFQEFIKKHVNKLSKYLYPYIGDTLDDHHAFVVSYEIGKDEDLDFHVDDSEVTLNICLGREFEGGELHFGGIRCTHHAQTKIFPDENFTLNHAVGRAVIHLGKHRHEATKIKSGSRFNMIVWCKSKSKRTLNSIFECPEWCRIYQYLEDE